MRRLSPTELLDVWERATSAPTLTRPLVFLAHAEPRCSTDELVAEPLGRRDARLLELREALVGPRVDATAECPACGEQLELSFTVDEVRAGGEPEAATHVVEAGYEVSCRSPTTRDLEEAASAPDPEGALFDRCVATALHDGRPVATADLPREVLDAVDAALERADPQAEVLLDLSCPACATPWSAPFDVASFLSDEVSSLAARTLVEVDALARAYGWREPDVLALTPWRRERYLELVLG